MKNNLKIIVTSLALIALTACNDDNNFIPKPSSYLNTNFPKHEYVKFELKRRRRRKRITTK